MKISSACRQRPYTLPGKCNRTPDTWCHIGSWYLPNIYLGRTWWMSKFCIRILSIFSIFSTWQKMHHCLMVVTTNSLLKSKTTTLKSILLQNECMNWMLIASWALPIAQFPLLIAYHCQMHLDKETVATTDHGALSVWRTRTAQRGRWGFFVFCICNSRMWGFFCILYLLFKEVRIFCILYFVYVVLIGERWRFFIFCICISFSRM